MKKTILTLCAAILCCASAYAQQDTETRAEAKTQQAANAGSSDFAPRGFWSNWEIGLGFGSQFYLGENDWYAPFGQWLTFPALDLTVTKWFTPSFGAGLRLNGFKMNGLYHASGGASGGVAQNYDQMVADHALPYFATDKEVTTVKGKTYNKQEGYFFNPYLFAILNLHGLVDGYKPSRMYELSLYGGIGMMAGYYDPAQSAIYANHPEYNGRSYAVSGHFGILNTFRIAKNLKLFVLGHGAIVGEAFDNEKTPEVPFDGLFGLSAGLTYQFGK